MVDRSREEEGTNLGALHKITLPFLLPISRCKGRDRFRIKGFRIKGRVWLISK
jgi:hypothetical protein